MKQRIISGVVMGFVVAAVLLLGLEVNSLIITIFLSAVAALGVYELVFNAAKIQDSIVKYLAMAYTALATFLFANANKWTYLYMFAEEGKETEFSLEAHIYVTLITIVYIVACAVLILIKQKDFDLSKIAVVCGMPIIYAFAFSTLDTVIFASNGGIYYLLLILNFACVCDMGAYFVGVSYGKTKLCPEISPKKTVEGALGGLVSAVIVSLVITLCYGRYNYILPTLLFTIPLCVVGMIGDLFASVIKRKVDIKDYGNLIPGHGGILDRVDSILFISPIMLFLILFGVI